MANGEMQTNRHTLAPSENALRFHSSRKFCDIAGKLCEWPEATLQLVDNSKVMAVKGVSSETPSAFKFPVNREKIQRISSNFGENVAALCR